ncbi:hypothetical protein ABENE_18675 [Asticcacaulis benevestitus DSM 16100 = ATCC BAA-896]|uniref:Uncharacterized protein n=1 Tax=Asticcacaulis benevestitus DSM 16100 = ATCC BAA-896 TaxID=1121022 RepID=V4NUM6_9CAUL|nr:hypothetical protein ABENE_18675 [Asticcacaulis benevestitus DSM 16100 = ATCC BAA-896]
MTIPWADMLRDPFLLITGGLFIAIAVFMLVQKMRQKP